MLPWGSEEFVKEDQERKGLKQVGSLSCSAARAQPPLRDPYLKMNKMLTAAH